jgi:hypothetical protein
MGNPIGLVPIQPAGAVAAIAARNSPAPTGNFFGQILCCARRLAVRFLSAAPLRTCYLPAGAMGSNATRGIPPVATRGTMRSEHTVDSRRFELERHQLLRRRMVLDVPFQNCIGAIGGHARANPEAPARAARLDARNTNGGWQICESRANLQT